MKNIFVKSLIALALVSSVASCKDNGSDFLDQKSPSSMDDANIFASYDLAKGTIPYIYNIYGEQNYRARHVWYGYNTDVETYGNNDKVGDGKADLAVYATLVDNSQLNLADGKEPWSNLWMGIERANLVIEGLTKYTDDIEEHPEKNPKMAALLGEAYVLRAYMYMDLINIWGDVPARFKPISAYPANDPEAYGRSPKGVIYAQIIEDLQKAAYKYCCEPGEYEATSVERVNKYVACGILARACLQAAGKALEKGGDYTWVTADESTRRYYYEIAYNACDNVISSGKYKLAGDFQQIFSDICQDKISNGRESIWEIGYANSPTARGRLVYTFGNYHEVIDGFVGAKGQGGQVGPTPTLFFDYDKADQRRDVTCIPYRWDAQKKQSLEGITKWYFGKMRYEWMGRLIESTDDGINKLVLRYADIYLMKAEAAQNIGKNVEECIMPVMTRAYGKDLAESKYSAATDKMQLIKNERKFEFAGELLRKADLIRWGDIKTALDQVKADMYDLRELKGKYAAMAAGKGRLFYKMSSYSGLNPRNVSVVADAQINFWGMNPGETPENVPSGYTEIVNSEGEPTTWINTDVEKTKLKNEFIEAIYAKDPVANMYWPIFQINLNDNQQLNNHWYN